MSQGLIYTVERGFNMLSTSSSYLWLKKQWEFINWSEIEDKNHEHWYLHFCITKRYVFL